MLFNESWASAFLLKKKLLHPSPHINIFFHSFKEKVRITPLNNRGRSSYPSTLIPVIFNPKLYKPDELPPYVDPGQF